MSAGLFERESDSGDLKVSIDENNYRTIQKAMDLLNGNTGIQGLTVFVDVFGRDSVESPWSPVDRRCSVVEVGRGDQLALMVARTRYSLRSALMIPIKELHDFFRESTPFVWEFDVYTLAPPGGAKVTTAISYDFFKRIILAWKFCVQSGSTNTVVTFDVEGGIDLQLGYHDSLARHGTLSEHAKLRITKQGMEVRTSMHTKKGKKTGIITMRSDTVDPLGLIGKHFSTSRKEV